MSNIDFTAIPARPCKRCGAMDRFENGKCKPCARANKAKWRESEAKKEMASAAALLAAEKESRAKEARARRDANPEREKERKKVAAAWRLANKDRLATEKAKWYAGNKDGARLAAAARYAANPEENRAKARAWAQENPERVKANRLAWRLANPGARKVIENNRRARKINSGGKLTKGLTKKLFALQRGMCPCCKQPLGDNYHLDHIVPLALGGVNEDWNMQLLRQRCNNQKHAKDPIHFMQGRGFLL